MLPAFHLQKDSPLPLYWQIYWQLREAILGGQLTAGARLPASRKLAQEYHVARVTVAQAYEQLKAEGFVVSRVGAGTFVADDAVPAERPLDSSPFHPALSAWGKRALAAAQNKTGSQMRPPIEFGFGRSFPHIFPYDIWRRLLARYLSTDDVMLSRYGSTAGFMPLRQALADYLGRLRGVRCAPEQVVIVSGAQQALDILARLLLSRGDEVLAETPGYAAAFDLFRTHGAKLVGLPVDEEGFPVEKIPENSRARLLFVTPSNQFPSGGTMPLGRRLALLQWARRRDALIIEDDYDGELRYDGRPLTALQGLDEDGRIVYLGTFSKVLFPALRLSYVVLPPALIAPFTQAKALVDRGAPTLTQAAVSDFITEGHFERHLRHLRHSYGQRRQVLVQALQQYLPDLVCRSNTAAGLHVMLFLPPHMDEAKAVKRATAVGVGIYPGKPYHLERPSPPSILLGFSGLTETDIEEGIRRLGTVLAQ
ncbi:MAG: PLP-dependent aminotransferase family protein [Chloroflexi bacterium]|nr:PLP-dependent aminotransferase family protein [Chloroflexota bacterium]